MQSSLKPSVKSSIHGDIIKRSNLFRWIREFIESQNMGLGYYMEFGVLNGECMIDAYRQLRGTMSHFYGFDSFEGLPQPSQEDQAVEHLTPGFHQGNFASMQYEFVKQSIMANCRIPADQLSLIKGFFNDSLPRFAQENTLTPGGANVIYIDCDLYSSTMDVLNFITPLIKTGTWILFDDYWCYRGSPFAGEQKAIRDWLKANPQIGLQDYCNYDGWGKAFIAYEN